MNIFWISQEKNENIDDRNNNIYYSEESGINFKNSGLINFFKQYKHMSKLKKEKEIEIIYVDSLEKIISLCFFSFFNRIPVVYKTKEKKDIEKELQHKIAYCKRKDIPVLMYHRVIETEEEKGYYDTFVTKENFEKQMKYLKENNYEPIFFKDIKNGEYKNRFSKKYVIITFDDGYKDNYKVALPILKKYNFKIVLFLITDCEYNKWDVEAEGREKEKRFPLMTKEEVQELIKSGLVEIGGHTSNHLDMPFIEQEKLKEDLIFSKEKLEKLTGEELVSFAYPWGNNDDKSKKLIRELGYKFAVATESGTACYSDDLYEIQRIGIYSKDDIDKFKEKISGRYLFKREKRNEMKKKRNKIRQILGIKRK